MHMCVPLLKFLKLMLQHLCTYMCHKDCSSGIRKYEYILIIQEQLLWNSIINDEKLTFETYMQVLAVMSDYSINICKRTISDFHKHSL